jgi:protein-tyrosine phosphatase
MPTEKPAHEALPSPRKPSGAYSVCLVCLGNICRSPMAEVVLAGELARAGLARAVSVESAGTGDWHVGERMFGPAREELARHGYDGSGHRARQIHPSWLANFDLVLALDRANLADLRAMTIDPLTAGRIRLLRSFDPALRPDDPYHGEVPDPFGGGPEGYALAYGLVLAASRGLVSQLAEFGDLPAPRRA